MGKLAVDRQAMLSQEREDFFREQRGAQSSAGF
jgi:hypothetical protein